MLSEGARRARYAADEGNCELSGDQRCTVPDVPAHHSNSYLRAARRGQRLNLSVHSRGMPGEEASASRRAAGWGTELSLFARVLVGQRSQRAMATGGRGGCGRVSIRWPQCHHHLPILIFLRPLPNRYHFPHHHTSIESQRRHGQATCQRHRMAAVNRNSGRRTIWYDRARDREQECSGMLGCRLWRSSLAYRGLVAAKRSRT